MATYWVPGLHNIKGFSGHLWHSILIFANCGSCVWSSRHMNMLAWVCGIWWLVYTAFRAHAQRRNKDCTRERTTIELVIRCVVVYFKTVSLVVTQNGAGTQESIASSMKTNDSELIARGGAESSELVKWVEFIVHDDGESWPTKGFSKNRRQKER